MVAARPGPADPQLRDDRGAGGAALRGGAGVACSGRVAQRRDARGDSRGAAAHRGVCRRAGGQLRLRGGRAGHRGVGMRGPDFVQSLERGLAVIRAVDPMHPELTLSEVATATGVTRAAARRFLLTPADLGYVRSDGRFFSLSPRVLELGYAYLSSLSLPEVAEPHLEDLVAEVNESSSVSVLDDGDVVYVARVPTSRIMTVAISVGTRFPAYATSMGRVLLAGRARAGAGGCTGHGTPGPPPPAPR